MAALEDSTSQVFAEKVIPKAKLITTNSLDEALGLLFEGKVEALIADYPFCAVAAFRYQGKGLVAGEARLTFEPLGIGLAGNDPLVLNCVGNFLGRLKSSGELGMLTQRWFKDGAWVKELPYIMSNVDNGEHEHAYKSRAFMPLLQISLAYSVHMPPPQYLKQLVCERRRYRSASL